ncbi:MAG: helix-hairpin-helix domain-containing protein, partial [Lachnospiraceae bacterium]|nr:helix-hairpin-helix domain-containing protein [Lachnospiraceae bacterium]
QHDMNQKKLGETLEGVVEDCVNRVGVDLNTASVSLLEYISGISKAIAKNIVDYRESNGRFTNRQQLLKVAKLGPKAYEQCAGFLRIQDGDNPLDATSVHPESYEAAEKLLKKLGLTMEDVREAQRKAASKQQDSVGQQAGKDSSGGGSLKSGNVGNRNKNTGKQIQVRNTNTAMGRALAQAMGGIT